ncbi:MAG: flagellar hook capping protein [Candidatus Coatesbacteria bacterium]|nr:flagellar hook capping protein [Candidatus Coatesbacteria bacterium]
MTDATSGVNGTSYDAANYTQTTGKGAAELGEQDFYTLLVAQMKSQNPLEPMSNEDYIAQLAQFSSLAQLSTVNKNLIYLQLYQASLNNTLAVSLVGKDVKVGTPQLELKGGQCNKVWYTLESDASEITILVKDSDGNVVRQEVLGTQEAGEYTVQWDGKDSQGNMVSDGAYRVEVIANDEDGASVSVSYGIRARVTGIAFEEGVTYLLLNGQKVPLSEITEILEGGSQDGQ